MIVIKDRERSSVAEQSAEVCCSSSAPEDSKAPVQLFGHASFVEQSESRSRCSSSAPGDPKARVKLLIRPCLVCRACKYPTVLPTTSCSFEFFLILILYNYLTAVRVNIRHKCPGKRRVAEIIFLLGSLSNENGDGSQNGKNSKG